MENMESEISPDREDMADILETVRDVTLCHVCKGTFDTPKLLPCLHTFCMNCLDRISTERETSSGDMKLCPICDADFAIPKNGFKGLQTNDFIEKLVRVKKLLNPPSDYRICDACRETDTGATNDVCLAEKYCVECSLKLCQKCIKHHARSRLTRDHALISFGNQTVTKTTLEALVPSLCDKHQGEHLRLYCSDCKLILCAVCFIECHRGHQYVDANTAADTICNGLKTDAGVLTHSCQVILAEIKEMEREKEEAVRIAESASRAIMEINDDIKKLLDRHAETLLQKVDSLARTTQTDLSKDYEDYLKNFIILGSYNACYMETTERGSANDICVMLPVLAKVLADSRCRKIIGTERRNQHLELIFCKSKLYEFLSSASGNVIGRIQANQALSPTSDETNDSWLNELLSKPDKLTLELENQKADNKAMKIAMDELLKQLEIGKADYDALQTLVIKYKGDKGIIEELRKQLKNEKENVDGLKSVVSGKDEEIGRIRKNSTQLQATVDSLKRELEKVTKSGRAFQSSEGKLRSEFDKEKERNATVQTRVRQLEEELKMTQTSHSKQLKEMEAVQETKEIDSKAIVKSLNEKIEAKDIEIVTMTQEMEKMKQKLCCQELEIKELQASKKKEAAESTTNTQKIPEKVESKEMQVANDNKNLKELDLKSKMSGSTQQVMKKKTDEKRKVKLSATAVKKLETKVAKENYLPIWGITTLNHEMFVVTCRSTTIDVYDATSFSFKRQLTLGCLVNPQDAISCQTNKCLYIADWVYQMVIYKVDAFGKLKNKWITDEGRGRLSLASDSNVILAAHKTDKIVEYTADGILVAAIKLSTTDGFCHILHAIKLSSSQYLVSHGVVDDILHRVCLVDGGGTILKSFGGETMTEQLFYPMSLTVDGNGSVLVADWKKGRVLVLDSDLKYQDELLSRKHGLSCPGRMHLNESGGQLLLANNLHGLRGGCVLVFQINYKGVNNTKTDLILLQ